MDTDDGKTHRSAFPPILATGFHSALTPVSDLFEWDEQIPRFTEEDQSTLHPGLYYSGPSLVQRKTKFCFLYKFRARFGVIAASIASQFGLDNTPLVDEALHGFHIADLDCCTDCECEIETNSAPIEEKNS